MIPRCFTWLFSISSVSKSYLHWHLVLLHHTNFEPNFNALCIKSQIVLKNFPLMKITTSSEKPCTKKLQFLNRFSIYTVGKAIVHLHHMHSNSPDIDKKTARSYHDAVYPPIYSWTETMIARRVIHRFKRCVVKSSLDISSSPAVL
jgi:hypothetical protein